MFKNYILFLLLFIGISSFSQHKKYWIDENGKTISEENFDKKRKENKDKYSNWMYKTKDSSVTKLFEPKFSFYKINHKLYIDYINKITNKKLNDSTNLIIQFRYENDLCSGKIIKKWYRGMINERKETEDQIKEIIEKKYANTVYFIFFEKGIALNNSNDSTEYFYSDSENFLRSTVFLNPTFCGSYLVSKPDGKTVIINGENRADFVVQYLEPKNWNQIFSEK